MLAISVQAGRLMDPRTLTINTSNYECWYDEILTRSNEYTADNQHSLQAADNFFGKVFGGGSSV